MDSAERDRPRDPPPADRAATAAEAALDRRVTGATRIEEALNAVYRIDLADGERVVLKAPTLAPEAEFLAEPHVLSAIGRETDVPVPEVRAIVEADEGPLPTAHFCTDYRDGRRVSGVSSLSPAAQERLVREAGRILAAIHDVRVVDGFGTLRVVDGDLAVSPRRESWRPWFVDLANDAADGLLGEGPVTDAEPRFSDLEPTVRRALTGFESIDRGADGTRSRRSADDRSITPAVLHNDYRPANLVLAPDDESPITRAVLDFGSCPTGDGLLDLAHAEDALVDMPFGGTDRAERLRTILRRAYVDRRDGDARAPSADDRYPYYRLYARVWRLALFDFWVRYAREDDPGAVEKRWRSFVRDRVAAIEGG